MSCLHSSMCKVIVRKTRIKHLVSDVFDLVLMTSGLIWIYWSFIRQCAIPFPPFPRSHPVLRSTTHLIPRVISGGKGRSPDKQKNYVSTVWLFIKRSLEGTKSRKIIQWRPRLYVILFHEVPRIPPEDSDLWNRSTREKDNGTNCSCLHRQLGLFCKGIEFLLDKGNDDGPGGLSWIEENS